MVWDYIVVGAGSAGCALAYRLSEDPACSVLLLEAGPRDDHWLIPVPKAFSRLANNPRYAWFYPTERMQGRGLATECIPRGKMLGGSSSLNGMIYMRGLPGDYDGWAAAGNHGWKWDDVLPAFRQMENHSLGATDFRGTGGPLVVTAGHVRSPLADRVIMAGEELGLRRTDDLNDPAGEGIGYYCHTISKGRRFSAARAFLRPALARRNLTVRTDTDVLKVLFEDKRAVGVSAMCGGRLVEYRAASEVIIASGAFQSPKLLQLSGIGPGPLLSGMGIPVLHENAAVGLHLREHVGTSLVYPLLRDGGDNANLRGVGLLRSLLKYALFGQGVLSTGGEVGVLARADPDAVRADTQMMLAGFSLSPPAAGDKRFMAVVDRTPGFTAMGCVLQPTSEGEVTITSPDPAAMPRLRTNWLATAEDQAAIVRVVRLMRRLMDQPVLRGYLGEERMLGSARQSDEQILDAVSRVVRGFNHAVGTCRMGQGPGSVVDERLRVRGVINLRVADCSIMPTTISGNTNAPAMMVGWRAADFILSDRNRPARPAN